MHPVSRGGSVVAMASSWQPIQGGVTAPNGFQAAGSVAVWVVFGGFDSDGDSNQLW